METICISQKNVCDWQKRAVPTVMALGYFDGLHLGHCEVIKQAGAIARECGLPLSVMTFTPHPKTVLSKGREQVHHLMPLGEKAAKLEALNVDRLFLVTFDREFAALSPEQFAEHYLVGLGVVHAVAGFDFSYGYRGAGKIDRLQQDSKGKISVTKVQQIGFAGEKISSTCIRQRILAGNVEELPSFLGHWYEVKCDWNGFSLKPLAHYTMPAPGCYEVVLKKGREELEGLLHVKENGVLEWMQDIPGDMRGTLLIGWKRRLGAGELLQAVIHE